MENSNNPIQPSIENYKEPTMSKKITDGAEKIKICFVVMGFGKKTDYPSGRTLDLDATYTEIIKPAAEASGFKCIRADEIIHSGVIDVHMYEMLLRADLVIADISTGNQNAIYELGVRHALRPYSTVIMKESEGSFYFDLDHINTLTYKHLGEDIGSREARRVRENLSALIKSALSDPRADSPVYTFLPGLRTPSLTEEQVEDIVSQSQKYESAYFSAYEEATKSIKEGDFTRAAENINETLTLRPNEPYLIQLLALCTYKSESPSALSSLIEAWSIISTLDPAISNDPETLGLAGSIKKRIWRLTDDFASLKMASELYGRGFDIRRDYYNGENHALCLNLLSHNCGNEIEASYYEIDARKVREKLKSVLIATIESSDFEERSDKKWIHASLANTLFGLEENEEGENQERKFLGTPKEDLSPWEVKTYRESKELLLSLIGINHGKNLPDIH